MDGVLQPRLGREHETQGKEANEGCGAETDEQTWDMIYVCSHNASERNESKPFGSGRAQLERAQYRKKREEIRRTAQRNIPEYTTANRTNASCTLADTVMLIKHVRHLGQQRPSQALEKQTPPTDNSRARNAEKCNQYRKSDV